MHAQVELSAGPLRCTVIPSVGGAIAGLWFHDTAVLRPCDGPRLRSPRDAGCFALVPFSNRIGHGRLNWQGQQHRLHSTLGDAPHAIHGIGWQRPWRLTQCGPSHLDMAYQHSADALWPFPFVARQQLELFDDHLQLRLSYRNTHTIAVPVGLGWHPYFHKNPNSRVHFLASGCWNTSWDKLPTHRTPSDGLQGTTADMAVDNCFDGWTGVAHIEDDRIRTTVRADTPFLVVYTRADLDFIAIEPVSHVSNAVQLAAALPCSAESLGLHALPPGHTQTFRIALEIAEMPAA